MSIYVDFHVLQTVPPSCVNRDDTGSPKTAVYGGSVRARVSSQAWKHAMRKEFRGMFAEADALFFMSNRQAKEIARLACGDTADKNDFKKALKEYPSVDIALFGRMAASDPTLNYDAASQVAHAISTHAVQNEYDYFTAVDDISEDDNAGAGHLGTVEFNSSTLYRYANVNVSELRKTLDDAADVAVVVRKFAEAFIRSMPTGKENTFANRTFPDAVYVTIRMDQPVNLCGAFEKPVRASEDGYATESEKRLAAYAKKIYSRYAAEPKAAFCIGDALSDIAQQLSLPELLDTLESNLREQVSEA